MVEQITTELKKRAAQPIIMKLSPNVTDITEIAKAAQAGGADALSIEEPLFLPTRQVDFLDQQLNQ